MSRGRVRAVGSADTVLGLGLLGIEGTEVRDQREAAAAFAAALREPGVSLVLLGERWSDALRDALETAALDPDGPLVAEVPDGSGEAVAVSLTERVERVLGVRLER